MNLARGQGRAARWAAPTLAAVALVAVTLFLLRDAIANRVAAAVQPRVTAMLEERLEATITIGEVEVRLGSSVTVRGTHLAMRRRGHAEDPALVVADAFTARLPWSGLLVTPTRVASVEVSGLRVAVPSANGTGREQQSGGCQHRASATPGFGDESRQARPGSTPFVVDRLTTGPAELLVVPRQPGKPAHVFSIQALTLRHFAFDRGAEFEAALLIPLPRGRVTTRGTFGPWNAHEPGYTRLQGDYTLEQADLGTFEGIEGLLDSTGTFEGVLQQIEAHGDARVRRFGIATSKNRLPLEARFAACVDGTDGDTYLEEAEATLDQTPMTASGKVEGQVGGGGRLIVFNVEVHNGRIEDLLRLALDDPRPLMTGGIDATSQLQLPHGPGDVLERLALQGRFQLRDTRFRDSRIQAQIDELSRRGRGDVKAPAPTPVRADLGGDFAMSRAVLRLPRVRFAVPGALVQLGGFYNLKSEAISFSGQVVTNVRVSQMTTGATSVLLKAVDPVFTRGGHGTIVPITIGGTRTAPSIHVDVRRLLRREP